MRVLCNPHFGGVRLIVLAAVAAPLVLGSLAAWHWSAPRATARQQAALVAAIERRSAKRLERLLAPDYQDQWGFDRDDAILAVIDVASQFIVLNLFPEEGSWRIEGREAEWQGRFDPAGHGSPLAQQILREARRLDAPFVFRWRKQSAWPGDWKLQAIDHPDLDARLQGYQPGDLRRALRGE